MVVGAVSYLAAAPLIADLAGYSLSRPALACGAVISAGAALAPDFDTPTSTIAHALGFITETAARGVGAVFGGHRHGTHSLIFCGALGALTALALAQTQLIHLPRGYGVTIGVLVALIVGLWSMIFLLGSFARLHGERCLALAVTAVAIAVVLKPGETWLPAAVVTGCLSHLVADGVTPEGIEPFWPVWRRRFHFALVGHTGDAREAVIVLLVAAGGVVLGLHEFRAHPATRSPPAAHQQHAQSAPHAHRPAARRHHHRQGVSKRSRPHQHSQQHQHHPTRHSSTRPRP